MSLRKPGPIQVVHRGLVDHPTAWQEQERYAARRRAGTGPDVLMLLEHPPVYTAGRRTAPEQRPVDGTPVVEVDRGGLITWHGPGQLVGYPIVALRRPGQVRMYVAALEEALVRVCRSVGLECEGGLAQGRLGVWMRGTPEPRKIAALGIRVQGGVTTHGFALNVDPDLSAFEKIIPCGLADSAATSVARELGCPVTAAELANVVQAEVLAVLD